jgi:uncharacterized protein YeaO (DUF488 family)
MIRVKRTYDPPARGDGWRVLVERLWPRGMKKEALAADAWLKEVAPSTELRKWFDHQVERWDEFRRRYRDELKAHPDAWQPIVDAGRRGTVTLLYSAHDTLHNGAIVLRDYLMERNGKRRSSRRPAHSRGTSDRPGGRRRAAHVRM